MVRRFGLALVAAALVRAAGAEPSTPIGLALVLDTSGSIGKEEFERSRALCTKVLEGLPAGSEAALFTFDDQSRLLLPWTSSPADMGKALSIVERTGRFTALHDALFDASLYLRDAAHGRRMLLLITDGKDEGSTLDLDDGLRVAFDNEIPVYAVGVGHVEERVLKRIAKLTSGEFTRLSETEGRTLATRMVSAPPPRGPAAARLALAEKPGPSAPAAVSSGSAPRGAAGPAAPASGRRLWAALGAALVATCALGFVFVRRRQPPRCPTCGLDLSSPLAACTYCSAKANERIAEAAAAKAKNGARARETDRSILSETVIARMNQTEEFLEKTVTLRERPVLAVTGGPGSGRVFTLSTETATGVGRARINDVVLDDVSVSSEHCRIHSEEGAFVLHDLKSTNGTFVNEKRVSRHPLAVGDLIKVGETVLQFRMDHGRA